jgi:hypothetical protein
MKVSCTNTEPSGQFDDVRRQSYDTPPPPPLIQFISGDISTLEDEVSVIFRNVENRFASDAAS